MTTRVITTLAAVAAAALTAGGALAGCATGSTPGGSPASSQAAVQDHNPADIAFAQGMIPHHAQAVEMSEMAAQRASSPQVKDLAARIQAAQQPEIDQMSGWLRAWKAPVPPTAGPVAGPMENMGQMEHGASMPGMMSGEQMQQLSQATGAEFDRMFLQMMITHHQGAVTMAQKELSDGYNAEARRLAQQIIHTQQREITEMQQLLARR
jgi:uncharacterized protein (DUF305 family)